MIEMKKKEREQQKEWSLFTRSSLLNPQTLYPAPVRYVKPFIIFDPGLILVRASRTVIEPENGRNRSR
jgi:hypothetical protein